MADIESIPAPRALPLVGNLHQIPKAGLIGHLLDVSADFVVPGIFKLRFGSRVGLFVTHPDLVAELCDETRFRKIPGPGLRVVRKFAGDGLFTAFSEEANWGKAHRILLPAFAQRAMRGYFDLILEVCDQLIGKWSAHVGQELLVADDFTRLTLDSIAIADLGIASTALLMTSSTRFSNLWRAHWENRLTLSRGFPSSSASPNGPRRNSMPISTR